MKRSVGCGEVYYRGSRVTKVHGFGLHSVFDLGYTCIPLVDFHRMYLSTVHHLRGTKSTVCNLNGTRASIIEHFRSICIKA